MTAGDERDAGPLDTARRIAETVRARGGRALLVGGWVRDRLLGLRSKDIDIEVYGVPAPDLRPILERFGPVNAVGESFNIGNPRSTVTIYQLARLIARLSGSRSEIRFVPWDFPDVELRIPDVKKAEKLLGFRANVDLEDGLSRTLDWYKEHRLGA